MRQSRLAEQRCHSRAPAHAPSPRSPPPSPSRHADPQWRGRVASRSRYAATGASCDVGGRRASRSRALPCLRAGGADARRGRSYTLSQDMLRRGRPASAAKRARRAAATLALVVAAAAAPRHAGALMGLLAAAALGFGVHNELFPERRHKIAGTLIPIAMKGLNKAMRNLRAELLKGLKGKVLDVGCASGLYLPYAKDKPVSEYVALEPNTHMHGQLRTTVDEANLPFPVRITGGFIDALEEENGTYDCVILGNVLCEVPCQASFLNSVRELLKPGGCVIFSEHVLDDDVLWRRAMQHMLAWWWCAVSDGCHCNRRTMPKLLSTFGEANVKWSTVYAGSFPWTARFELGVAVRR